MLLNEKSVPRRYRRGPFERLRVAIAHLLYGRVIMLGDRRAAIAAMGAFYARTSELREARPIGLDAAVNALTRGGVRRPGARVAHRAEGVAERPEEDERLLLAALRVGSTAVHLARETAEGREESAAALRQLDERSLDQRLTTLLSG